MKSTIIILKEKKLDLLEKYNYFLETENYHKATIYRAKLRLIDEILREVLK